MDLDTEVEGPKIILYRSSFFLSHGSPKSSEVLRASRLSDVHDNHDAKQMTQSINPH